MKQLFLLSRLEHSFAKLFFFHMRRNYTRLNVGFHQNLKLFPVYIWGLMSDVSFRGKVLIFYIVCFPRMVVCFFTILGHSTCSMEWPSAHSFDFVCAISFRPVR